MGINRSWRITVLIDNTQTWQLTEREIIEF